MKIYAGIDLHSNNSYVVLIDESDNIIYQKRLGNDLAIILKELKPYQLQVEGIVVESTYNWYWLVDGLKEAGYRVHLANTVEIKQYTGLKHTNDKTDAIWLARLLKLGILKEGYIYPKEQRGLRELLRKRLLLVRQQTMSVLGVQGRINRYENCKLTARKLKTSKANEEEILSYIHDEHVRLAVQGQLKILQCIVDQLEALERIILKHLQENVDFKRLKAIPGIGSILAMTILLETGEINRFKDPGNYSSYCRCVESKRISNFKKKGENNRKNGNHYLGWAYIEASNFAVRYYNPIKQYYQRKLSKTNRVIALKTIANKLSKACYFVLRDKVDFDMNKAFV